MGKTAEKEQVVHGQKSDLMENVSEKFVQFSSSHSVPNSKTDMRPANLKPKAFLCAALTVGSPL